MGNDLKNTFPLSQDSEWVTAATEFTEKILNTLKPSGEALRGLRRALLALERLPQPTAKIYVDYAISYRDGDKHFSEMRYFGILMTSTVFEISSGGSVYDPAVGSDSFTEYSFTSNIDGRFHEDGDIYHWLSNAEEFLNLGPQLDVEDESDLLDLEIL